ncbi:MAG: DMT family transporter [Clostridia bacterium]|nr:DMT family transporter [Clostridia bacterium]
MNRLFYALPIAAGIMFGSVGVFVRKLYADDFSNATVLFSRAVLASVMLLIYILITKPALLKLRKQNLPWVFGCAVCSMLVTNICFNISRTTLSLAFAAVLLSIAPVYSLIISRFAFGSRITRKQIVCVAMTIAGCILVSGVIGSAVHLYAFGVFAGIISGISYGLFSIFSKKGIEGGLNPLTITFYSMLIVSVVLAPFTDFPTIAGYIAASPLHSMLFLIAHSLTVGVLPYLFLAMSSKHLNPGTVNILASCEPVAAMIFGVIFYNEVPTVLSLLGLIVTVVALGILCKGRE